MLLEEAHDMLGEDDGAARDAAEHPVNPREERIQQGSLVVVLA